MKKSLLKLFYILLISFLAVNFLKCADPSDFQIQQILSKLNNYRYGLISVYEVDTRYLTTVTDALGINRGVSNQTTSQAEPPEVIDLKNTKKVSYDQVQMIVNTTDLRSAIEVDVTRVLRGYDPNTIAKIIDYFLSLKGGGTQRQLTGAYLVTTRPTLSGDPAEIISLIISESPTSSVEGHLKSQNTDNIYTRDSLSKLPPPSDASGQSTKYTSLYDYLMSGFAQGRQRQVFINAGIGKTNYFNQAVPKKFGQTRSLITDESYIASQDIQMFMRVSEGQPFDYTNLKNNELIVSPDLISWKQYKIPTGRFKINVQVDTFDIDSLTRLPRLDPVTNQPIRITRFVKKDTVGELPDLVYNEDLPSLGFEVRFGNEDINYPSFWSERITASAMWNSAKLGLIMPFDGYSSLSKSLYGIERKLTYAGAGITGSFEYPIQVIDNSGIFHLSGSYVFGDAVNCSYKNRNLDPNEFVENVNDNDFLIRYNAQLHYTFGIEIDRDYLFRFGVGATLYNVERWYNTKAIDELEVPYIKYVKKEAETVGGISGRIDFMSLNSSTPVGASLQYFDQNIYTNLWLQVALPFANNVYLRLEAKGYFSPFRDKPHDWENNSVFLFIPRLVFTF